MASKRESTLAGGGDASMFGLNLKQLKSLMTLGSKELTDKINTSEYNGVNGVLEKLKVDPNRGLDSSNQEDLEQRRIAFGVNEIPPKPMRSFLKLCWDALHDLILEILLACAIISIGLSFYKPPQDTDGQEEERK
jgi:P-type Ca2+ transporter type 2B